MKTRENELHEPKISFGIISYGYFAKAHCSVCGEFLEDTFSPNSKDDAIFHVKLSVKNYCPYCGAQLKEVDG